MKFYMFWTVRLSIIRSLFTVHSAMVYVILEFHKRVRITSVYVIYNKVKFKKKFINKTLWYIKRLKQ
jgi:hypothetical protein